MFGMVKVYKPELRIKEYEMYKSVYCSLCKFMGKKYGIITRFLLSYDFAFLSLLNMSLADKDGFCIQKGRCTCNPLKKCNFCNADDELSMPSAAAVIMTYYKIADDVADEKGIKKLFCNVLKVLYKKAHKKAAFDYPGIEITVKNYIDSQQKAENNNADIDAAAEPTANALAELFTLCGQTENDKRALERLGYCVGKYIYLTDALTDLKDDIKKHRFNPLIDEKDAVNRAQRNIYVCINEAINAFELIAFRQLKNILGNIIYMGLEDNLKRSIEDAKSI